METKGGYVTVLPELCLNISKAANYCNMPNEARLNAEQAQRESAMIMDHLEKKHG